jgi:hypothetical protein
VSVDPQNVERLRSVLIKFGFNVAAGMRQLFTEEKTTLRMGVAPNQIEVLSKIAGVEFQDCYPHRQLVEIEGIMVPVIDYEDFKRNKLTTGCDGDRIDIERLEKRRQP